MRSDPGADDTVRLAAPRPAAVAPAVAARGVWQWVAAGAAAAVLAMGLAGWLIWPRQVPVPLPISTPLPVPAQRQAPAPQPVPALPVPAQQIPAQPAPNPQVPAQQVPAQPAPVQLAPAQQAPAQQAPAQQAPAQQAPAQQAPAQQVPAQPAPAQPLPQAALPPASPALAPFPIETADETEILAHAATGLTVFHFAANPTIVVLDFASLREQGLMLNRIAALTEKGAMPRDRVLNDTELDAAISAGGDTVETFYYGHDYSAEEMARFFSLAAQQDIRLNPEEAKLRALLTQLGWLAPDVHGGLISVPKVGANAEVTAAARRAILRHELAHGEYFSNPVYQAYVHQFWMHDLTQRERDGVRKFLASEQYDSKVEDLVENEMQAYLMFTRDPEFFAPAKIGMTPERLAELQASFQRNMPRGWLRDLLGQTLPAAASPY